ALLLPPAVALGAFWAGPIITVLLPRFTPGVPALRILALGALLLAMATLPGYALLGLKRGMRMLPWAAGAVLVAGLLVFSVAAVSPRASHVAMAAAAGQGCFALVVLVLGARELASGSGRSALVAGSLLPSLWAAALAALALVFGGDGVAAAAWRSLALALGYAPLLLALGRGLGLRDL